MIQNYNGYKVLKPFLKQPVKGFGLRELCKQVDLGPPSVISFLKQLTEEDLVIEKKLYGRKLYFANRESRLLRLYKQFDTLLEIEKSGLIEFLNRVLSFPTIILFGSKSMGEDTEKSDMDIAVITSAKKQTDLEKYETALGSKIHILFLSDEGVERMKSESKELLNSIINGKVLSGYLKVL